MSQKNCIFTNTAVTAREPQPRGSLKQGILWWANWLQETCEVWDSQSDVYKDESLLECYAVQTGKWLQKLRKSVQHLKRQQETTSLNCVTSQKTWISIYILTTKSGPRRRTKGTMRSIHFCCHIKCSWFIFKLELLFNYFIILIVIY